VSSRKRLLFFLLGEAASAIDAIRFVFRDMSSRYRHWIWAERHVRYFQQAAPLRAPFRPPLLLCDCVSPFSNRDFNEKHLFLPLTQAVPVVALTMLSLPAAAAAAAAASFGRQTRLGQRRWLARRVRSSGRERRGGAGVLRGHGPVQTESATSRRCEHGLGLGVGRGRGLRTVSMASFGVWYSSISSYSLGVSQFPPPFLVR